ncbi:zf-HC2 domain-containing protein [Kitasatospora sp. NPDC058965]|uniref:zf-HC2 domain-containing protein n=1 Tax=Kitasatospora sp. NPDC058965 TaxID=3346682 RepID=UPI0036914A33
MTAERVPQDPHLDVGAYALGLLDDADRSAFEAHLAGCPRCRTELDELAGLEPLLSEYAAGGGEPPEPDQRLLDALLGEVAATRRRVRVRRRWLVAVAAVLVVGGPAVTAATMSVGTATTAAPTATATATESHSAVGPTGAHATVGVTPTAWGSAVTLTLDGVTGPRSCDLVAVAADGSRQTVTTWSVPATGYGARAAGGLTTGGGAGLTPDQITRFEIRDLDSGQLLVSVPGQGGS